MTYEIKYRKKEGMKDSGIEWLGKVTREWRMTRIKYISDLIMGQSPDSNEVNQNGLGIPFLQGKAEFGEKHPQAINYCIKPKKNSEIDDILISVRAPVGELNISDVSYCIGRGLAAIRGNSNNNKYLFYSLLSYKDALVSYATGTTFESVSISQIKNLTTLKVDFIDQQKITNFLDLKTSEFDSIISKKEKLIAKLEEAKKSLISEVVTGKVKIVDGELVERKAEEMKDSGVEWVGMIPKDWEVKKIKHIAYLKSGETITSETINPEGTYPVYGGNGLRGYTESYTHSGNYVLIGRQGALCGNINYANGEFWASEHAIVVNLNGKVNIFWFGELLRIMNLNQYSVTAAQPGISVGAVNNLMIPYTDLDKQNQISNILSKKVIRIDSIITKTKLQIQKLKLAKQSLISEAVTGKIDLSDWEII